MTLVDATQVMVLPPEFRDDDIPPAGTRAVVSRRAAGASGHAPRIGRGSLPPPVPAKAGRRQDSADLHWAHTIRRDARRDRSSGSGQRPPATLRIVPRDDYPDDDEAATLQYNKASLPFLRTVGGAQVPRPPVLPGTRSARSSSAVPPVALREARRPAPPKLPPTSRPATPRVRPAPTAEAPQPVVVKRTPRVEAPAAPVRRAPRKQPKQATSAPVKARRVRSGPSALAACLIAISCALWAAFFTLRLALPADLSLLFPIAIAAAVATWFILGLFGREAFVAPVVSGAGAWALCDAAAASTAPLPSSIIIGLAAATLVLSLPGLLRRRAVR